MSAAAAFGFLPAALTVAVLPAAGFWQQHAKVMGFDASVRWVGLDLPAISPLVRSPVDTFSLLACVKSELEMLKTPPWLLKCTSV